MSPSRILVVDDDPIVRNVVCRILRELGTVVDKDTGADALAALQTETFDLVVSDIRMPPPDGLEIAAWVRKERPGTPIILISGFARTEDEAKIAGLGATLLRKPFDAAELRQTAALGLAAAGR